MCSNGIEEEKIQIHLMKLELPNYTILTLYMTDHVFLTPLTVKPTGIAKIVREFL